MSNFAERIRVALRVIRGKVAVGEDTEQRIAAVKQESDTVMANIKAERDRMIADIEASKDRSIAEMQSKLDDILVQLEDIAGIEEEIVAEPTVEEEFVATVVTPPVETLVPVVDQAPEVSEATPEE